MEVKIVPCDFIKISLKQVEHIGVDCLQYKNQDIYDYWLHTSWSSISGISGTVFVVMKDCDPIIENCETDFDVPVTRNIEVLPYDEKSVSKYYKAEAIAHFQKEIDPDEIVDINDDTAINELFNELPGVWKDYLYFRKNILTRNLNEWCINLRTGKYMLGDALGPIIQCSKDLGVEEHQIKNILFVRQLRG
jgi:hypothetical protein